MLIAVTGASGFVGGRLTDNLLQQRMTVRALRHRGAVADRPGLEIIKGSLDELASLALLVRGVDAVIHCGGLVAARRRRDFHAVNADGTKNLVEAAIAAQVPRFLLVSSLAATRPTLTAYASSKRKAETFLTADMAMGWDILRPPAIYGPGDRQVLTLIKALQAGIALLPGGKAARASILHVDDLVAAIGAWLAQPSSARQVHALDDGVPGGHLWRDILGTAARQLDIRPRFISPPPFLLAAAGHAISLAALLTRTTSFLTADKMKELRQPDWLCRDDGRFTALTGWRPAIGLEAGLSATLDWYRTQGWLG